MSEVLEELIEFILSKLNIPGGKLLAAFLIDSMMKFIDSDKGDELILDDVLAKSFEEELNRELEREQEKLLVLSKRILDLEKELKRLESELSFADLDLSDLREAITESQNKYIIRLDEIISAWAKYEVQKGTQSFGTLLGLRLARDNYKQFILNVN